MRILKRTIALALAASLVIPASSSFAVYGAEENNNQINVTTPNQDDLTIGYSGQSSYQALAAGNWQSTIEKPTSLVSYPDDDNNLYSEIIVAVNTNQDVHYTETATLPARQSTQNSLLSDGGQQSETPPDGYGILGYTDAGTILEPAHDYSVPSLEPKLSRAFQPPHQVGDRITIDDGSKTGKVEVEMVLDSTYCTVWREVGDEELSPEVAQQIANEYNSKIYPKMSTYFADEVAYDNYFGSKYRNVGDGDGKLAIACHDIKDGYQDGSNEGFVAGFVSSGNLLGYNTSTPIDLIHIDTYPAMTGKDSNAKYNPEPVYGTFAHELQHLLHYYALIDYEESGREGTITPDWLNEGMSEAASDLCGYDEDLAKRILYYDLYSTLIRDGFSFMDWQGTLDNYSLSSFFTQYMMAQSSSGSGVFKKAYESNMWQDWDGVVEFFKDEYGLEFSQIIENYRAGLAFGNLAGGKYSLGDKVKGLVMLPYNGGSKELPGGGAIHNGIYTKATSVNPTENIKYVGFSFGNEYTITAKVSDGTNESTAQEIKAPAGAKVVLTPDLTAGQKVTSYTTSFDSDVNKPTQNDNQISFIMPPSNVSVTANVGEADNHTVTITSENLTIKAADDSDVPATVVDGSDLSMVVTANEGYKVPETVSVKMKGADGEFADLPNTEDSANPEASYYTYAASETEPEKYELTIHKVSGDIEITASGVEIGNEFPVTYNFENVSCEEALMPPTATPDSKIVLPIYPDEGYALPYTVEIKMDGRVLDESEYTYDRFNYRLTITNITGPLEINVIGIPAPTLKVNYNLVNLAKSGPDEVKEEERLEFKLIPDEGYELPEVIRITMNDIELEEGAATYTYDRTSGDVSLINIRGGDINVYAEGVSLDEEPTSRHQVTYNLERLGYTGPNSVAHGETLIVGLIPEQYSALPETVEVTMGGSPAEFEYIRGQGSIKVENVIDDVVIYAVGIDITPPESGYAIQYELTNMYKNGAPSIVGEGEQLSATLYARSGYILPDEITVSMGGVVLTEDEYTYTHDRSWGTVVIPSVTGDVLIQGTAIRYSYPTPNPTPDNSGTGGGIIINGDTSGSSGSSSSSDSSSSSSPSKPYTEKESTFKSISELGLGTIKDKASSNVDSKGAVKSSNVVNAVSASNKDVSVKNAKTVTNSILKKMAAKNPDARLVAETTKNGKTVAKLILNAKDSKNYKANLSLNVEVNNKALKSRLVKAFSNNVQAVILSQGGNFGAEVEVAAKITTTSIDKNNLKFYTYDRDKNSYKEIDVGNYTFDSDGMVHFTTSVGGDILISNGELKKK